MNLKYIIYIFHFLRKRATNLLVSTVTCCPPKIILLLACFLTLFACLFVCLLTYLKTQTGHLQVNQEKVKERFPTFAKTIPEASNINQINNQSIGHKLRLSEEALIHLIHNLMARRQARRV